jgi:hypothetical protein
MLGLYLAAVGFHALAAGNLLYRNYLHSPMLAPVSLIVGIVLIAAGLWMRE